MRKEIKKRTFEAPVEKVASYLGLLKAIAPFCLLLGVLVVFAYCIFNRFVPDIQLDNALVFVFAVLGLALVVAMGLFLGVGCLLVIFWAVIKLIGWLPIQWLKEKINQNFDGWSLDKEYFNWPMLLGSFLALLIITIVFLSAKDNSIYYYQLPQTLIGFLPPSIFLLLIFGVKTKKSNNRKVVEIVTVLAFLFFVSIFMIGKGSGVIQLAMQLIGVSQHGVEIVVNKKTMQEIKDESALYGINPKICKVGGSETYLISDVDLTWHGIGAKTWLSTKQRNQDNNIESQLNITVKSEEVSVLHKTVGINHKDAIFDITKCKSPD